MYISCIFLIWLFAWEFPFPLHVFSLSAHSTWIWWAWLSISPWIIFCRFPNILNISLAVYALYLLLACKMVVLISTNCMLVTSVMMCVGTDIFFSFIYFSWFNISFLLIFFFIFFLLMMKRHVIAVTWHITWCEVIGLKKARRD